MDVGNNTAIRIQHARVVVRGMHLRLAEILFMISLPFSFAVCGGFPEYYEINL
jgi:hypothetical protein